MIGTIDWAIILWVSVCWGLLARGSRPKPMVPTMPHFSWLGRSFFPGRENRMFGTCLMWGLVDVNAGESQCAHYQGIFLISGSHLMQLFRARMKLGVSIRGLQGGGFLCASGWCGFSVGEYG